MLFIRPSGFDKSFRKLPKKIREKAIERLGVSEIDQFDPLLNNHKLRHEYAEYRSINIAGDHRIVYRMIDAGTCFLMAIGDHDSLFGL